MHNPEDALIEEIHPCSAVWKDDNHSEVYAQPKSQVKIHHDCIDTRPKRTRILHDLVPLKPQASVHQQPAELCLQEFKNYIF